jgi:hypothetical protein
MLLHGCAAVLRVRAQAAHLWTGRRVPEAGQVVRPLPFQARRRRGPGEEAVRVRAELAQPGAGGGGAPGGALVRQVPLKAADRCQCGAQGAVCPNSLLVLIPLTMQLATAVQPIVHPTCAYFPV